MKNQKEKPVKGKKSESNYNPTLNDVYKGSGLHLTIQNAVVLSNNMNKPYYSPEYNKHTSNLAIELTPPLLEEIENALENTFANQRDLKVALANFSDRKVKKLENGKVVLYALVNWEEVDGALKLKKALPIDGLEPGKPFPYSFKGDVRLGFVFSVQKTFAIYFNQCIVKEVIQQESEFKGMATTSEYNPTVPKTEETPSEVKNKNSKDAKNKDAKKPEKGKDAKSQKSKEKFWK